MKMVNNMWTIQLKGCNRFINIKGDFGYENLPTQLFLTRKRARYIKNTEVNARFSYRETKVVKVKVTIESED
jgi:hypothetical protein